MVSILPLFTLLMVAEPIDRLLDLSASPAAQQEARDDLQTEATRAIDERNWKRAAELFDRLARQRGNRADGALYWKAYAQNKLGERARSLETIAQLLKSYPKSRWANDAKAMDLEIRQSAGQNIEPDELDDEELKLIALMGLIHTDQDRAVTTIEKLLAGRTSDTLKEKALFVLSQSEHPRAQTLLANAATGRGGEGLQISAVRLLGINQSEKNRAILADAYRTGSAEVKKAVLHAYMISSDRARVLEAARGEKDPELRAEAVRMLGVMGARDELWELYRSEASKDVKEAIIQSMFVGGHADRLHELARNEKDPDLRATAIRNLGLTSDPRTGQFLLSLYNSDAPLEAREAVIEAFFIKSDAKALISLARAEKNAQLKREIVQKLALMDAPEARRFMQEILEQ